jgi:hypothetical protein
LDGGDGVAAVGADAEFCDGAGGDEADVGFVGLGDVVAEDGALGAAVLEAV